MNNLLKRTLSGIVFLIVMVFGIIWDRLSSGALFLVIMYFCLKEFYTVSLGKRMALQQKLGILTAALAFVLVAGHFFFGFSIGLLPLVLLPILLIPASCLIMQEGDSVEGTGIIYGGLLYVALPFCLFPLIVMDGDIYDGWLLLSFFILIWMSDVGAYCLGTLFGQKPDSKKLAPSISPKKSWWGFWSGIVFCVAAAVGLHYLGWLPFHLVHCIVLGILVSVGGVCGDLYESLWKRRFGVKDSGNIIPGHGGMLDRFDSSIVAIPLGAVYLALFGLI